MSSSPSAPSAPLPSSHLQARERQLVLLIAAVQFVNILDFVMVMPLGPQFARSLGFAESANGAIAGAYTAAAAVSGLAGSFFLDRFDRRPALILSLIGLVLGTLAGAFAWDFHSLLAARVIAGIFGGPATSLSLSIIADVVPPERRGKAMGTVMGAFGAASVLGIPLGIFLGMNVSWRLPFVCVAGLGALIIGLTALRMPRMRDHLRAPRAGHAAGLRDLFSDRLVLLSYLMTFVVMLSGFIVIPNISAYVQGNLALGPGGLMAIYLIGGACSFLLSPPVGRLVDRIGALRVGATGTLLFIIVVGVDFIWRPSALPVVPMFVAFFLAMTPRNVAYNTLASKVPRPELRARFMSIQSAVQHSASALGGFAASAMLSTTAIFDAAGQPLQRDGHAVRHLVGVERVAIVAIALALTLPLLMAMIESRVARRARAAQQAADLAAAA